MSSCGIAGCLGGYSVIVTTILVIISILYSNSGTTIIKKCNNISTLAVQSQTQTHMDILTLDFSNNDQKQGNKGKCQFTTLTWLGFEIFEILILVLVGIGMIFGCFKCTQDGRVWIAKWMEARKLAEFETMRLKYEASSTARQESVKIESTELAGYQKGDNFQSDDEKAAATKNWSVVKTN